MHVLLNENPVVGRRRRFVRRVSKPKEERDLGYRLRVEVTARNAAGSAIAASATTAVIRPL